MLLQGKKHPGIDHTPRMFAVTKALLGCGAWNLGDIRTGGVFANIRAALALDPVNHADLLVKDHDIPPELSVYLIKYLTECAQDIRCFFNNKRRDQVKELQTIHADLSDRSSFLKLQKTILRLTEDYWNQL